MVSLQTYSSQTHDMHAQVPSPPHKAGIGAHPSAPSIPFPCCRTHIVPSGQPSPGQFEVAHERDEQRASATEPSRPTASGSREASSTASCDITSDNPSCARGVSEPDASSILPPSGPSYSPASPPSPRRVARSDLAPHAPLAPMKTKVMINLPTWPDTLSCKAVGYLTFAGGVAKSKSAIRAPYWSVSSLVRRVPLIISLLIAALHNRLFLPPGLCLMITCVPVTGKPHLGPPVQ
jgi:hypothetical protein